MKTFAVFAPLRENYEPNSDNPEIFSVSLCLRGKLVRAKEKAMAFLLDDILLAPLKGVVFLAKKVHDTAMEEILDEEGVRQDLRELYMLLETKRISEEEFEEREETLVERLEEIQAYKEGNPDAS